jgi:hypothetical protein
MDLDQQITDFLARAGTNPAASKLVPYAELIRQLRQRRWPYQRIADALRNDFGVSVAPSTIHAFVKVRAKQKGGLVMSPPNFPIPSASPAKPIRPRFHLDR